MAASSAALNEIEAIEDDDIHHDFGGAQGNKGHDFAHFWLITRVIELETANATDYMFLCEYVQDVAEFNSSAEPTDVILYQLKKRETGYWSLEQLTGQSSKSGIKSDRPIVKLHKSVCAFKTLPARGVFVSNAPFDIPLQSGDKANANTELILKELEATILQTLTDELSAAGYAATVDTLRLHTVALDVNDLQVHTTGKMVKFLEAKAPDHVPQASSLVDTLYLRIRGASRISSKCKTWQELTTRRGLGRADFINAVQALRATPDRATARMQLLELLAKKLDWRMPQQIRITQALAECSRDKILVGKGNRWEVDRTELRVACVKVTLGDFDEVQAFNAIKTSLSPQLPSLDDDRVSALAIWEMVTEWTQKPTPLVPG